MAGGRPPIYSEELAEKVLDKLASDMSLVDVCKLDGMPSPRTVLQWAADDEEFAQRYARAREVQAEFMDGKIMDAAEKAGDDPQAARVKIDAYKWRAAKLAPKKYGDSTTLKHADADGDKIPLDDTSKFTRLAAMVTAIQGLAHEPTDDAV